MSDDDTRPVGFLGKLRNQKVLTWVLLIGLVALTVGGGTIIFLIQALTPGN